MLTVRTVKNIIVKVKLVEIRLKIDKHNLQIMRNSLRNLICTFIIHELSLKS